MTVMLSSKLSSESGVSARFCDGAASPAFASSSLASFGDDSSFRSFASGLERLRLLWVPDESASALSCGKDSAEMFCKPDDDVASMGAGSADAVVVAVSSVAAVPSVGSLLSTAVGFCVGAEFSDDADSSTLGLEVLACCVCDSIAVGAADVTVATAVVAVAVDEGVFDSRCFE